MQLNRILFYAFFGLSFQINASFLDYKFRFNSPSFSNYGTVGLINAPTARFLEEGSLAFTWSHNQPYLRGSIVAYPFSWLEASYQYADINNDLYSPYKEFSGGQSLKDKSFDAKFRVLKESNYVPSLAIGFRDLGGTGIFSSEYIVASKMIGAIDLSIGLGWGALSGGDKYKNPFISIDDQFRTRETEGGRGGEFSVNTFFSGNMALYGGLEYNFPFKRGLKLKLEYDPINYEEEGTVPITNANSNWNIGFVMPITKNITTRLGIVRGNNLNFQFSYHGLFRERNTFVKKNDPPKPVENSEVVKAVLTADRSNDLDYKAMMLYLGEQREIWVQSAEISVNEVDMTYVSSRYFESTRTIGRATRVLDQIMPDEIKTFKLTQLNAGMTLGTVEIQRDNFKRYEKDQLTRDLFLDTRIYHDIKQGNNHSFDPEPRYPSFHNNIEPALRSQIGGPDGFYFGEIGISATSEILLRDNITINAAISMTVADNFEGLRLESDSVLPHVRSDIVRYLRASNKNGYYLQHLQLDYFKNPFNNFYFKVSGGLFEQMFGGYGFEALYRPFDRNWALGIEAWNVKQREYDMLFDFLDYKTKTGHINFYFYEPKTGINFALAGGRYLAKDSGFTFDFSRRFKSGMNIGAFFSLTDISKEEFGEGSFDKGVYFNIPIQLFFNSYGRGQTAFSLKPLTRDGAARMFHHNQLISLVTGSSLQRFNDDWEIIYD